MFLKLSHLRLQIPVVWAAHRAAGSVCLMKSLWVSLHHRMKTQLQYDREHVRGLRCDLCVSCLFLGAGRAVGPGPELCQLAVDWTAVVVTTSRVRSRTQRVAAAHPVILILHKIPVKKKNLYRICWHRVIWGFLFHSNNNWKQQRKSEHWFLISGFHNWFGSNSFNLQHRNCYTLVSVCLQHPSL